MANQVRNPHPTHTPTNSFTYTHTLHTHTHAHPHPPVPPHTLQACQWLADPNNKTYKVADVYIWVRRRRVGGAAVGVVGWG